MKKIILFASLFIIILGAGFFSYQNKDEINTSVLRQESLQTLTAEQIREVIENGTEWFKNAQEKSGHFKYEYMPFLDRYIDDDNMVRQSGGLYVLGELYRNDTKNKFELLEPMAKAISFFEKNTVKGEFQEQNFLCVMKTSKKCSIGGTSLTLIGIIDLVRTAPLLKHEYEDLIEGYKNYIMAMKLPEKGFRNSYYPEKDQSEKESHFGNGEAFLALTRYYKYNPDEEVKQVIDASYKYFEEIYFAEWDNNFYLWGMAAIKDLYTTNPREEYFKFVKDYTDWRISKYKNSRDSSHNKCAYIEGVISAYSVLEPNLTEEEKEYYLEEIDFWLSKSRELQVNSTDELSVTYNDVTKTLKIEDKDKSVGGFLTDVNEPVQRIDFTQHCLNSYLQKLVDVDGERL